MADERAQLNVERNRLSAERAQLNVDRARLLSSVRWPTGPPSSILGLPPHMGPRILHLQVQLLFRWGCNP
eukprot:8743023-Karenia_brevis.AAC.1